MISLDSTTSAISSRVRPDPNICSNCLSVEIWVIRRFAAGTDACSFSAAVREISTTMTSSAALIVAPRRRPEIRPTSPKIEPCSIGTVIDGSSGLISTATEPSAMAKSELPGSFFSKITSPRP